MVGIVAHSQLITPTDRELYQITIIPPDFTWDRIIFNIATGLGLGDKVVINTFQQGISFGTVKSKTSFSQNFPVRQLNPIPARLGTSTFLLTKIHTLPTIDMEVCPGTPVLITFTVSSYEWSVDKGTALSPSKSPGKMKDDGFKDVLSLNLQEVVVLQDMIIDSGESDDETAENDTGDVFR
ncbi:hypothetical protein K439DRAFT_1657125 [Ramaria rubella]|nr:hypothetical protein K439DRAFT_1657125 [Ramaria rubella]